MKNIAVESKKNSNFFKVLFNLKIAAAFWFGLSIAAAIQNILLHSDTHSRFNNYFIFKNSFLHIANNQNMYLEYPLVHQDVFLYGPAFTLLIAPFSFLPDSLGVFLWIMFNTGFLFYALLQLPLKKEFKAFIILLSSHEMMNASSWLQYNASIIACLIMSYSLIIKQKDFWALAFIVFAAVTKVYGIIGFSFFLFSKQKLKFILGTLFWSVFFYFLPALYTSINFVHKSYTYWFEALIHKTQKNTRLDINNFFQDISVMGLIRRNIDMNFKKDNVVLIIGAILYLSQTLYFKYFKEIKYQLYILCSSLILIVIFSTGAESPTYIIAFPACCIWYILQPKSKWVDYFFIFCLLVVSFSYSDIFTKYCREFSMRHSIKALPCLILWCIIVFQIHTKQFIKVDTNKILN